MAFIPVENVALVEIRVALDLQKCENTIYAQSGSAFDETSLSALATAVKGWWVDSMASLLSDQVTLTEVVATDLTSETAGQVSVSGDAAPGSQIGGCAPNNASIAIGFHTSLRGRSFRGRNYVVGIPLTQLATTNTVDTSWLSDVRQAYNDLKTTLNDSDFAWVVVSRFSGVDPDTHKPIPRDAGVATLVTTVVTADNTVDSQRRRLPGRGQ